MTIEKHKNPKNMSLERYLRGVYVVKCRFILNIRNLGAKMPPPQPNCDGKFLKAKVHRFKHQ